LRSRVDLPTSSADWAHHRGSTRGADRKPVRARDLKASGAMTLLLKDAIRPTWCRRSRAARRSCMRALRQHRHGCNSMVATALGSRWATSSSPRPASASDLGAEKFFDIKCRMGGLKPEAAVLVATIRALKMQGGAQEDALGAKTSPRSSAACHNLEHHVNNVQQFGVPVVVAINRFV
jgi:formate--tetrahydrofolate ligase